MTPVINEDILLNIVYPHGPTRSRELKTLPESDVLYHASRSLKVYGVPGTHRDSFVRELTPPLSRDEEDMVSCYTEKTALMQVVMDEERTVGILVWSKPDRQDAEGKQAVPLSGSTPATQLLCYIYKGDKEEDPLDPVDLATDMLEHQWLLHLGKKLASADARLYEVSPTCFQGSIPPDDDSMAVACYSLEFETENTESTERSDKNQATAPMFSQGAAAKFPVPEHLIPSLRETVGEVDFDGPYTLSYPCDAILASAFMAAASGGNKLRDVIRLIQCLSPKLYGPFGIPITADLHHLKQDVQEVCEDQYIPFFLTLVEDWMRDRRADLPESLHPDTPEALKTLFNLACILHVAGAPYE